MPKNVYWPLNVNMFINVPIGIKCVYYMKMCLPKVRLYAVQFSSISFKEVFCATPIGCGLTLRMTATYFQRVKTGLYKMRLILAVQCG